MKLIDEIRSRPKGPIACHAWIAKSEESEWRARTASLMGMLCGPMLETLQVIKANNVSDYYYDGVSHPVWDLRKDFPCLAPPYNQFWVEYNVPKVAYLGMGSKAEPLRTEGWRAGVLFLCGSPQELRDEGITITIPDGTHWVYLIFQFLQWNDRPGDITGPPCPIILLIDKMGQLTANPQIQPMAVSPEWPHDWDTIYNSIVQMIEPALLTICFMHCRNVERIEGTISPKLAKRTKERCGVTPAPFKTLVLEPMKKILRKEGRSDEVGLPRAMTICRGHWVIYPPEGPGLFGKGIYGRFYIPQHRRGSLGDKPLRRDVEVKL